MNRLIKKVAIIGSGSSGLASAKYAVENGLSPVIFDKESIPGGIWASNRDQNSIWENLHSNLTTHSMSFSDHFYPANSSLFASKTDIHNYLLSYAKRFELEKYLRLQTNVESAIQLKDNKWQIHSTNTKTNSRSSETFDFLVVASGLHLKPRVPDIKNKESFKGLIMHSSKFQLNDERLKSKRVVVVGCCHSGADISSHLVDHASQVTNLFRRPYIITRRFIRFKSESTMEKKNSFNILPIDLFINRRSFKAPKYFSKEQKIEYYSKMLGMLNLEQTDKSRSHPELFFDLEKEAPRVAISDNYYGFIKQGKIVPKKMNIKRFEPDGVVLDDGSFEKADAVLFCTGYDLSIDYFNDKIKTQLGSDSTQYKFQYLLYNSTFHPALPNLAMIYQNEGVFLIAAELQSRWASLVFSGKTNMPDHELMCQEINKLENKRKLNLQHQYPIGSQVDIIDGLGKQLGIHHDFEKLKVENPNLFNQLWNNVSLSCHYRLDRDETFGVLNEIDRLKNTEYIFKDNDERSEVSITEIADKFRQKQTQYKIPMHLFRT